MPDVKGCINIVVACDETDCFTMRALPVGWSLAEVEANNIQYGWRKGEDGRWRCPNHAHEPTGMTGAAGIDEGPDYPNFGRNVEGSDGCP